MHSPTELLLLYRAAKDLPSDGKAAKALGITRGAYSNWMNKRAIPDDDYVLEIAQAIGLNEGYVAACFHAARAKTPKGQQLWQKIANTFRNSAAVVFVALIGISAPTDANATTGVSDIQNTDQPIHYASLRSMIRRLLAGITRLLGTVIPCPSSFQPA
jgi:transcriptional regulator with XRE-family HTH domain